MPGSTSDVRVGEPGLKYGPSVWAGVGWPEHCPDASLVADAVAGLLVATGRGDA